MKIIFIVALSSCVLAATATDGKEQINEINEGERVDGDFLLYDRHYLHDYLPNFVLKERLDYPYTGTHPYYKLSRLEIRDYNNTVTMRKESGGMNQLGLRYTFEAKGFNMTVKLWGVYIAPCSKKQ